MSKCSRESVEEQVRTAPKQNLIIQKENEKSKTQEACDEIFYNALETVKAKMQNEEKSALEIWKQALDNITPQVEVKSRRIGGATFQVPTEIRPDRKESVSMKNMIAFARKRSGKSMADKLAAEIMDAFNNQGGAFKMLSTTRVVPSSVRRICTAWLRLTAHLLTSDSKISILR